MNPFTGIFKDVINRCNNLMRFIRPWKNTYIADQLTMAISTTYKGPSKIKYPSKVHIHCPPLLLVFP